MKISKQLFDDIVEIFVELLEIKPENIILQEYAEDVLLTEDSSDILYGIKLLDNAEKSFKLINLCEHIHEEEWAYTLMTQSSQMGISLLVLRGGNKLYISPYRKAPVPFEGKYTDEDHVLLFLNSVL